MLVLEDGRVFRGFRFGAEADREGEVVFTTSMTGYQEICTDPSYRGELVCLTYPIIGSYGVTPRDNESRRPWLAALLVRELSTERSNWRMQGDLNSYLREHGIPGLHGLDTRALTRHLRTHGLKRGVLVAERAGVSLESLVERARRAPMPADRDVVGEVTAPAGYTFAGSNGAGGPRIVLIDCGLKESILRSLAARGAEVLVVPRAATAPEIVALGPRGVATSPGPGDPRNARETIATVSALLEHGLPYFGICLGHQLLALSIGARTSRLAFGHRGGNHPVRDLATGRVYITSQNHGFQVDAATVPEAEGWFVSHVNVNDGSVEGLAHRTRPVFTVQYHPEGSPGPQDNQYLFDRFLQMVES